MEDRFMKITRQDVTTVISELANAKLTKLIAAREDEDDRFCFFYLEAEGTWYRFFNEMGILFWDTADPDPEEDLIDNEEYIDIIALGGMAKQSKIRRIEMRDAVLTLSFDPDYQIQIHEDPVNGGMTLVM